MKTKILMVAPNSIPLYGAESIVNVKLLKLLTNNNFEVDLISKRNKWENYPAEEDLNKLDVKLNDFKIVVVDNKLSFKTILQHIRTFFTFGTVFKGAHWAFIVISELKNNLKRNKYDYVITKSSPSLLVGYYLKRKYGYKWIASWNDPYPNLKYPFPYGKGIDAKLPWFQKKVLKIMEQADCHIFPSERLKDYMCKYIDIKESNIHIIPHIVFKEKEIKKNNCTDMLRILHSGNVKSPRNPRSFILAIRRLYNDNPSINLKIDFVGVYDADLKTFISDNKLNNIISLLPPNKYQDSLKIIPNYNLAIIIEAECEEGIFLPTKVGDYMQYQIPIFTISPKNGLLNDLYQNNYIQYFSDNSDVGSIYDELKSIVIDFQNNNLKKSKFNNSYNSSHVLLSYQNINI
ncbi:hypothetical protein GCM10027284_02200 [Cyclobacterium sediminis]